MIRSTALLAATVTMLLLSGSCSSDATNSGSSVNESEKAVPIDRSSPESALRAFLIAMISGDRMTLEKTALPHERLDVLLVSERIPESKLAPLKKRIASMEISRLSPGDKITLPNGQAFEIDSSMVNENRQQLKTPSGPLPYILVREDGKWKVNAGPIIAGRLAAEAARKRSNR